MPLSKSSGAYGSVLVVGGCGFLGRHVVVALLEDPCFASIAVIDSRIHSPLPNVSYHHGDIISFEATQALIAAIRPRTIIHTVSPLVHSERPDPALHKRVTVDGTINLLACAAQEPSVVAFIYTSSGTIIAGDEYFLADESFPVFSGPMDQKFYSRTKAIADTMVLQANNPSGNTDGSGSLRTVCLRPSAIFGEGDVQTLPAILATLNDGQTLYQLGDNGKYFDFTYVSNVADAHVLTAKALLDGATSGLNMPKVDGEAFFITNDEPWRYWDFIRRVWAAAGYNTPLEKVWVIPNHLALGICSVAEWYVWITSCGRRRLKKLVRHQIENGCCMTRTLCIDKAKQRLGYRPRVGVEEGIVRGVTWLLQQNSQHDQRDSTGNRKEKEL